MLKINSSGFSVGVDIEEIERFRKLDFKNNQHFYEKIFTKDEIEYCLKKTNPSQHFCARFSAKEAAKKAISKFETLDFKQIQVINDKAGAPHIELIDYNGKLLNGDFELSLSHSNQNAIAFVVYKDGKSRRKG